MNTRSSGRLVSQIGQVRAPRRKINTLLRVFLAVGAVLLSSQYASAQSVLNFTRTIQNASTDTGIAITNPTSQYVDVQFTYFDLDGVAVSSGLANPVSYRIAPGGQLSMLVGELFASKTMEGWVQATSSVSGLVGFYFSGDFRSALEGSESVVPMNAQVIPFLRQDPRTDSEIVLVNPGGSRANVTVAFYNGDGQAIGVTTRSMDGHSVVKIEPSLLLDRPVGHVSARITSSIPVTATAVMKVAGSLLMINGQPVDLVGRLRIAPHFLSGNGFDSTLVLSNPNSSAVSVTVTLFNGNDRLQDSVPAPSRVSLTIQPNGSTSVDTSRLANSVVPSPVDGWVRVDSDNLPINGVVILDNADSLAGIPLQVSPLSRMLYSQLSDTDSFLSGFVLINDSDRAARLKISLLRPDGTTISQSSRELAGKSKLSNLVSDLLPEARGLSSGFIYMESSVPVYAVEMFRSKNSRFLAAIAPREPMASYSPDTPVSPPVIGRIQPATDIRAGGTLSIFVSSISGPAQVLLGDQILSSPFQVPSVPGLLVNLPLTLEPGFAYLRVRSGGLESEPVELRVLSPLNDTLTEVVSGKAFYQKVVVGDSGLDLSRPTMVPIRNARVEVLDRISQDVISVSETDGRGQFKAAIAPGSDVTIRVLSRLRSADLKVQDNTSANALYSIATDLGTRIAQPGILIKDNGRVSGAFNVLEVIQRGNEVVRSADPGVEAPPLTIFWSVRNTPRTGNVRDGLVGTTYFNYLNNTAYVLGDRVVDSDEYDDAVILHEYAHLLASRFSRDDSPGGAHGIGDMLDPRVAWSEGWANFFSGAARGDRIYRDSKGVNGSSILRFDLEENTPANDRNPGYWSEASIHSLLWDLLDDAVDAGDTVQYPLKSIWAAFTDLRADRFVYLPYFLERFLARMPGSSEVLREMVQLRSTDFQPSVRPSVTNPWPRAIDIGETVTGEVDSSSSRRSNSIQSSHFVSFTTTGGPASVRLDVIGTGAGNNPNANDLDLFLINSTGRVIERSDRGSNGQPELISTILPAGTYVIEVRSNYMRAETNSLVFNSGRYRLTLLQQ